MSVNDLLTQEEINALLSGKSTGDVIVTNGDLHGEDHATEDWGENEQIPALSVLNRRYAQLFRSIFVNLLRKEVTVATNGVNLFKMADYIDSLYMPSSVNFVQVKPLNGPALFVFDPDLVFLIIENYFGGDGRYKTRIKKAEFSPMELRLIELLLGKIFISLKQAWEPVMPLEFELISSAVNSQINNIDNPEEVMVASSFYVEIENDNTEMLNNGLQKGELQIVMPYSLLEDILGTDV